MKRFLLLTLVLALAIPAFAPTASAGKLSTYSLVCNGKRIELSDETGYIHSQSSVLLVPVQYIAQAYNLTVEEKGAELVITGKDGAVVSVKSGAKSMLVDKKRMTLRVRSVKKSGKLMVDTRVLRPLGLSYKHYKASAALRAKGYKGGALAICDAEGELTLPTVTEEDPAGTLPPKLQAAAKNATQIVGVRYKGGSKCVVTLYEKQGTMWIQPISVSGYLGKNGIDKTKEGDKRTPTGTFDLKMPFGIKPDPGTKMGGYLKVTKYHYWSGQKNKYYNQLVDTRIVKDYKPSSADEHLIKYTGVYNYAMLIDYNPEGTIGKGSAIFLHCAGANKYTAGCVAISAASMVKLLKVLDNGAKIVIYAD